MGVCWGLMVREFESSMYPKEEEEEIKKHNRKFQEIFLARSLMDVKQVRRILSKKISSTLLIEIK